MATKNRQDYIHTNVTCTSSYVAITNNLTTRTNVIVINQGVLNDMTTACNIFVLMHDDDGSYSPTTETGICLKLGDSIEIEAYKTLGIWLKSATTNATAEIVEYEKDIV
jgi:hypothetical protein